MTTVDAGVFAPLDDRMTGHVDRLDVGGAAWAVAIGDEQVDGAAGWLDPDDRRRPMRSDAVFRVASVSKPIVAVSALRLVQDGVLGLDDPVDAVLPELADRRVLTDLRAPLDQPTVPAERPLTLRDLLTFRCGLGMDFDFSAPQPLLDRMWAEGIGPGPTPPECGPDEFLARLGELPLADHPGTRWRYHTGSDVLGVLVERVRGETLEAVLRRQVLDPLGMTDTGFWVPPLSLGRLGACRMNGDDGKLTIWDQPDGRWSSPPEFRSGAAGLVSTTADLVAFGRMLLAGGVGPDRRVLDADLVAAMTSDQLTDEQRSMARIDELGAAVGWGFGLAVRREPSPAGWPGPGTFGWDGGLGSRWLVDPGCDLVAVVLSTDSFESPGGVPLLDAFVDEVGALVAGGRS